MKGLGIQGLKVWGLGRLGLRVLILGFKGEDFGLELCHKVHMRNLWITAEQQRKGDRWELVLRLLGGMLWAGVMPTQSSRSVCWFVSLNPKP